MAQWDVWVRNREYAREALVSHYALTAKLAVNARGAWSLAMPADIEAATAIDRDRSGIIVERDGVVQFSGPLRRLRRTRDTIEISGPCDNDLLARRRAFPSPDSLLNTDEETDDRTGPAETVMREYLEHNAGPTAVRPWRPVFGLADALGDDRGLGLEVTGRARFPRLLDLFQQIALAGGGLRFWVMQRSDATSGVKFFVAEAPDLTDSAVFAVDLKTAHDFEDVYEHPTATWLIALGPGQATDRTFVEMSDPDGTALFGIWEETVDRRQIVDEDELRQAMLPVLAEQASRRQIRIDPRESEALVYGLDYYLGATVSVVVRNGPDSERTTGVVRELQISLTHADGDARIVPLIGTPGASSDGWEAKQIEAIRKRIENLELGRTVADGGITGELIADGAVSVSATDVGIIADVIARDGVIAASLLDPHLSQKLVGEIKLWPLSTPPPYYLLCDGGAVSRTTYSKLFDAIGTTFGAGDGSTTFNVPDFRDRMAIGVSASKPLAEAAGSASTNTQHSHSGKTGVNSTNDTVVSNVTGAGISVSFTVVQREGHDHDIGDDGDDTQDVQNPYLAVNYVIYSGQDLP